MALGDPAWARVALNKRRVTSRTQLHGVEGAQPPLWQQHGKPEAARSTGRVKVRKWLKGCAKRLNERHR